MIADLTIAQAGAQLAARELSAEQLLDAVLERIAARADLGAYDLVDERGARIAARAADRARRAGEDGPLLGIPLGVKDIIDVGGHPTRAGAARWFRHPRRDAAVLAPLRAAGAVIVGKTTTNEFAYGIDGLNPHRPPIRNPRDPDRLTGGSSAGSAAAVAGGVALGALATDTSGSVRVPAAFCGVVGLRPTIGALPSKGVLELAKPYDVVGPMAADVEGTRLLWEALAGEAAHVAAPAPRRVLILADLCSPALCAPEVAAATRAAGAALAAAGLAVEEVETELPDGVVAAHVAIQQAAAAKAHAGRFEAEADRYAPDVRARLERGRTLTADDLRAARKLTSAAKRRLLALLAGADVLLAPSAPVPAPPRDAVTVALGGRDVPLREALLALPVTVMQHGGPILAVPSGTVDGLPVGVQLAGRPGEEAALLAAGALVEAASVAVAPAAS